MSRQCPGHASVGLSGFGEERRASSGNFRLRVLLFGAGATADLGFGMPNENVVDPTGFRPARDVALAESTNFVRSISCTCQIQTLSPKPYKTTIPQQKC